MKRRVVVVFDEKAGHVITRHRGDHLQASAANELGPRAEAEEIVEALEACGYRASCLPLAEDAVGALAALGEDPPEVVFNLCDTLCADGKKALLVPAALDVLGIPFTGARVQELALSKRKHEVKSALARAGIPTPRYQVLMGPSDLDALALRLEAPVILKPTTEHASIGIEADSVCVDRSEIRARAELLFSRFEGPVLVEEYIEGDEVYASYWGDPPRPLELLEQTFESLPEDALRIRTFDQKWFGHDRMLERPRSSRPWDPPAREPATPFVGDPESLQAIGAEAFAIGGCRDWGRVDFRVDARTGIPYVIDVTPNTYLARSSPCAIAAAESGVPFDALVSGIVEAAIARGRG